MGWYYTHGASRKSLIESLTKGWNKDDGSYAKVLKHCARGNVLWTVWEVKRPQGEPQRHIGCDLMQRADCGWGHKPMDEGMHPFYYTCPLSYLDMAPVASEEWRGLVRLYHKKAKDRRKQKQRLYSPCGC